MNISIIAAMDQNKVIGQNGKLPWNIPADLRRFKELTSGHTVIMGRKTYDSIGKPLPDRNNIVISKSAGASNITGLVKVASFNHALDMAEGWGETHTFIIGGHSVYQLALPHAHRMFLTLVTEPAQPSDEQVHFPESDQDEWHCRKLETFDDHRFGIFTKSKF
jgi:dihydrofolate reductase